jgi:hypothetical protein
MFSLPVKRASERVDIWRKLKRYGALPLRTSGYLLPNTAANQERFEWLATAIRKYRGQASVAQVHAIDDLPPERLAQMFVEARSRDYEQLMQELKKPGAKNNSRALGTLRKRFQEIVAIDFFNSRCDVGSRRCWQETKTIPRFRFEQKGANGSFSTVRGSLVRDPALIASHRLG